MNIAEIEAEIEKTRAELQGIRMQINALQRSELPILARIKELREQKFELQKTNIANFLNDQTPIDEDWLEAIGGNEQPQLDGIWQFAEVLEVGECVGGWSAEIIGNDNFYTQLNTRHELISLIMALKLERGLKPKDSSNGSK